MKRTSGSARIWKCDSHSGTQPRDVAVVHAGIDFGRPQTHVSSIEKIAGVRSDHPSDFGDRNRCDTAVFSVLNGVLLKPLPYPNSEQLVSLWLNAPGAAGLSNFISGLHLSSSMYFTFAEHNQTFESLGVWTRGTANVTGLARPEEVHTGLVSDGVLQSLQVQPAVGRWLHAGRSGSTWVKGCDVELWLLAAAFWRRSVCSWAQHNCRCGDRKRLSGSCRAGSGSSIRILIFLFRWPLIAIIKSWLDLASTESAGSSLESRWRKPTQILQG